MRCSASFSQFRMTFFEVLYGTNIKLQRYTVLSIATKIISKVADVVRMWRMWGLRSTGWTGLSRDLQRKETS